MSDAFVDSAAPADASCAVFDATALPVGDELNALVAFRAAAARIKAAEAEMRAASQAYGEAIKRLSEASTK